MGMASAGWVGMGVAEALGVALGADRGCGAERVGP